jgi:hypothetical protein
MAINFPDNPSIGQQATFNNNTWEWNGSVWNIVPAAAVTIQIGDVVSGAVPSITNVGTINEAVLNFVLPKGDKGDPGAFPSGGSVRQFIVKKSTTDFDIEWSFLQAADMPTGIDAAKIGTGVVSNTEFGYLDGVTSAIQTQLNGKQATLTNPVTGTGTSGQVTYFSGTSAVTGSNNLFWDNTNTRFGIGTNAPSYTLDVRGVIRSNNRITAVGEYRLNDATFMRVAKNDDSGAISGGYNLDVSAAGVVSHAETGTIAGYKYDNQGVLRFYTGASQTAGTTATARVVINASGNVSIGNTNNTYNLDVSGTLRNTTDAYFATSSGGVNVGSVGTFAHVTSNGVQYFQLKNFTLLSDNSANTYLIQNGFINTSGNYRYAVNAALGSLVFISGTLNYVTAPSGTAGVNANTTSRFYVSNTGEVGIGTTSPAATLDVRGNAEVTNSSANAYFKLTSSAINSPYISYVRGASQTWWVGSGIDASNNFSWYDLTGSSYRMLLTTSGNLGIGTISPSYKLDVNGTFNVRSNYAYFGGDANTAVYLGSFSTEGRIGVGGRSSFPTAALTFYTADGTNNFERMRITSAGDVGIGTISPTAPLHIIKTGGSVNSINIGLIVDFEATAAEQVGAGTAILFRGKSGGGNLPNYDQAQIATNNNGTNNSHGLSFFVKPNAGSSLTEAIRILSNSSVGIGTTSPAYNLDISGNLRNTTSAYFATSSGNVSIGSTSANGKLFVVDDVNSDVNIIFQNNNAGTSARVRLGFASAAGTWYLSHARTGGSFSIFNETSEFVTITRTSGYFGINNTNPTAKLDVVSDITTMASFSGPTGTDVVRFANTGGNANSQAVQMEFRFNSTAAALYNGALIYALKDAGVNTTSLQFHTTPAGSTTPVERMRIDGSGNVGIGITSPISEVHVQQGLVTLSTANLANGTVTAMQLTYPDLTISGGEGIAIALGMNGRGRSYIANLHSTTNKDATDLLFYTTTGAVINERLRITSLGDVGIGTSSPSYKLDVIGQINGLASFSTYANDGLFSANARPSRIGILNNSFGATNAILFGYASIGDGSYWGRIGLVNGSEKVSFGAAAASTFTINTGTSNTERLRITDTGDAGFGTSSPSYKVDIAGTLRNTTSAYFATSSGGVSIGSTIVYNNYLRVYGGASTPVIALQNDASGSLTTNGFQLSYSANIAYLWNYQNQAMLFGTNATERMRITADGKVSIGPNVPSYDLTVNGSGDKAFGILPTSGGASVILGSTIGYDRIIIGSGTQAMMIGGWPHGGIMQFHTTSGGVTSERMRINAGGNVSIGNTNNTYNLDISGTLRNTTDAYFATSSGGVVIGSTSINTAYKFDVRGNARITDNGTVQAIFKTDGTERLLNLYNPNDNFQFRLGYSSSFYYDMGRSSSTGFLHFYGNQANFGGYVFDSVDGERARITAQGIGLGQTTFGTSATKTLAVSTGVAPTTSPADAFQMYSADITAGNAAAHFRTEGGAVIKLYQETTGVAAATLTGGGGTALTDTDTFDGYTLKQIVKALRNQGLLS